MSPLLLGSGKEGLESWRTHIDIQAVMIRLEHEQLWRHAHEKMMSERKKLHFWNFLKFKLRRAARYALFIALSRVFNKEQM